MKTIIEEEELSEVNGDYWRSISSLNDSPQIVYQHSYSHSRTTSMDDHEIRHESIGDNPTLVHTTINSPNRQTTDGSSPIIHESKSGIAVESIDNSLVTEEAVEDVDWKSNICSPSYERQRMRLFRDTWSILQSRKHTSEGAEEKFTFNRIVRMVYRIFKAKLAVFTLVGPTEVAVIARAGTDMEVVKRHYAFCGLTVEECAPPLFMIHDAINDDKFKDHPFVVNEPHVRFYCGAPIYMHGFKIGTLSIADGKPRPDFGEAEKLKLQEFAGMIADLLMEQRKKAMSIEIDYAKITVGLFAHFKKPLLQAEDAFIQAQSVFHQAKTEAPTNGNRDNKPSSLASLKDAVQHLTESIDNLNVIVENSLQLSLSLFNHLSPHEASELVPLVGIPSLMEDLIASVMHGQLPKGMKGPIEVVLDSSQSFPVGNEPDQSLMTLVSVNLSMLWMILYSILSCECKCRGTRLRILLSLFPADPDFSPMFLANPDDKRGVNAVMAMKFLFDPVIDLDFSVLSTSNGHETNPAAEAAVKTFNFKTAPGSASSTSGSNTAHCDMDNALEYLLKSFGGRTVTFDPQVVHHRRKSIPTHCTSPAISAISAAFEQPIKSSSISSRPPSRSQSLSGKVVRIELPCEVKVTSVSSNSQSATNGANTPVTPSTPNMKLKTIDEGTLDPPGDCSSPSLFASGRNPTKPSFPVARWIVSKTSLTSTRLKKYLTQFQNEHSVMPEIKNPTMNAVEESSASSPSEEKKAVVMDGEPPVHIMEKSSPQLQSSANMMQNTSKASSNLTAPLLSADFTSNPPPKSNLIPNPSLVVKQKPSPTNSALSWIRALPSLSYSTFKSWIGLDSSSNSVKSSNERSGSSINGNARSAYGKRKVIPTQNELENPLDANGSKTTDVYDHPTYNVDSYSNHGETYREPYRRVEDNFPAEPDKS